LYSIERERVRELELMLFELRMDGGRGGWLMLALVSTEVIKSSSAKRDSTDIGLVVLGHAAATTTAISRMDNHSSAIDTSKT
jgi:hypothetical protein